MPLQPQIQSDVVALLATIPTVKEAVLTKQGLRTLRDEILYRNPKNPLKANDNERLQSLGLNQLLVDWLVAEGGRTVFDDIKNCGPDALLQAFDAGLKQVELVQLTLAYVASVDDAARFHKWFNQVLNRPVMLDLRLNPQLLAGVMFVYQNHLYDYSLRRQMPQVEQALLDNYKQFSAQQKIGVSNPEAGGPGLDAALTASSLQPPASSEAPTASSLQPPASSEALTGASL